MIQHVFLDVTGVGIAEAERNPERNPERRTIARVVQLVAEHTAVTVEELDSRNRTERVAHARFMAMALAREATNLSLVEIGRFFKRDHGTVIHACRFTADKAQRDRTFSRLFNHLLYLANA